MQCKNRSLLTRHWWRFVSWIAHIYLNNNTRLLCACCPCSLGMWLTRPFHDNWQQSIFICAMSYQSIKRASIFTSFIIRGWSTWWVREHEPAWINYPGQPARSLLTCAAPLLIIVRMNLHKGKGASLRVLLRIMQTSWILIAVCWNHAPPWQHSGVWWILVHCYLWSHGIVVPCSCEWSAKLGDLACSLVDCDDVPVKWS